MVLAVRIWAYNGRPRASLRRRFSIIIPMRLRFDIWLTRVFWTIQENLTSILPYGTIRGNMQQIHIRGGPNEICENEENPFKSVIEKIDEFRCL